MLGSLVFGLGSLSFGENAILIIASILFAIVVATVIYKLFKPLFIIFSSIFCMLAAFSIIGELIAPNMPAVVGVMSIVGFAAGVIAMFKQFKSCKEIAF